MSGPRLGPRQTRNDTGMGKRQYFGFVKYTTEDPEVRDITDNDKFCSTQDALIRDIVEGGSLTRMLNRIFIRIPRQFTNKPNSTWEAYFDENPIDTVADMQEFLKKFHYADAWFHLDIFQV